MSARNMMSSSLSPKRRYKWHHILVSTLCICALVGVLASMFTTINSIHNMKRKKKRSLEKRSVNVAGVGATDSAIVKQRLSAAVADDSILVKKPSLNAKRSLTVNDDSILVDKLSPSIDSVSSTNKRSKSSSTTNKNISINDTDSSGSSGAGASASNDQGGAAFNVMEMNSDQQNVVINDQPKNITTSHKTIDEWLPGVARNTSTVEATLLAINSTKSNSTSEDAEDVDNEFESGVGDSDSEDGGSSNDQVDSVDTVTTATAEDQNDRNNGKLNSPTFTSTASTKPVTKKINSTVDDVESAESSASSSDEEQVEDEEEEDEKQQQQQQKQQQKTNKMKTKTSTAINATTNNISKTTQTTNNITGTNDIQQQGNASKPLKTATAPAVATPVAIAPVFQPPQQPQQPQQQVQSISINKKIQTAVLQTASEDKNNAKPSPPVNTITKITNTKQPLAISSPQQLNNQKVQSQPALDKAFNHQGESSPKLRLVPVKNAFHFANESQVLAQQQVNVTSSLYSNEDANERAGAVPETKNLEGEVRNIDEDHKADIKPDVDDKFPTFPNSYHATGIIILPESKIAEPFEIWYAPDYKKSRIDYYYGNDKTYQRGDHGDYGVSYKYVPMFNDKQKNFEGCYKVVGNQNRRIIAQVITPNMTWFKYNKTEVYTGVLTTKWTYKYTAFGMENYQSVWVTKSKPYRPIRYEMFGFDMMLGSYYDNYVINYVSFEEWTPTDAIFELPQEPQCSNWSNSLEASLVVNPMQEFTAFRAEDAVDHAERYSEFKEKHYKEKTHPNDAEKRKHVYKHNSRFINSHNRRNLTFKLQENVFADKFEKELEHFHGSLERDSKLHHEGIKEFHKLDADTSSHPVDKDIPEELDWRDYGAVSSVGGQGICGACYAFSAAEAVEGAWYRKTSKMVRLSKQQLVDCSWGSGNHGCKGGHYAAALSWVYVHGISTAKSYGKYLGQEGYCHFNDTWFGANIEGFTYVPVWNATALKRTVAHHGPVAISLNTMPMSFKFYSKGIYDDPKCSKNTTTHSALVVGYGKTDGREYWIVKNSWSSLWGENGYIKVAMKDDLCGVTEYPVAVIVKHPSFHLPRTEPLNSNKDLDKGIKDKDAKQVQESQQNGDDQPGTNVPMNPSGTDGEPSKDMPGNLNNNDQNDVDKQKDNNNNNNNDEDLQEDEDEKVSRKAKQHAAAAKNRKLMLRQNLHQNHFEHETSMFEKSSSNKDQLIPTIKGLHIEDIGKDIQKIHQLLVDTADTEHGLNGKASSKIQESAFSSSLNQNTILTEKRQPSLLLPHSVNGKAMGGGSKKATRSSSKAQVSDPSRPVYTTSNQLEMILNTINNDLINKSKLKTKKKTTEKVKRVNKSNKNKKIKTKEQQQKKQQTKKKEVTRKELAKKINNLIGDLSHQGKLPKHSSFSTISLSPKIREEHILNPEKIGVMSHNSRRSKSGKGVPGGTKRTTITRLDSKQKLEHQRRIAKKKSRIQQQSTTKRQQKGIKKSTKSTKPNRPTNKNSKRTSYYNTSPSRRTMDIRFMGLPTDAVTRYLQMEHMNLRKEFKTKRKTITPTAPIKNKKKSQSTRSHKRNHVEQEAQDAIDIAKQNSMDSLYSFIDRKVHDYTKHNSKKHSISYYKHHIHNGK